MTKAGLIARLGENKDTPFYKANYNVEEVIELLICEDSNKVESLTEAMDYIEEHIAEELPPFSILGADTREWIKNHIKEYIDVEYFDSEVRNDLIKDTEFSNDCIDTDNAEFEIDYGNQVSVDKDSICIDDDEVKRTLEDLVTEFVDNTLDAVDNFCENIDSIEQTRKARLEAKAKKREQELQDLQRKAEAEMEEELQDLQRKAEAEMEEEKSDEEQVDETENDEN